MRLHTRSFVRQVRQETIDLMSDAMPTDARCRFKQVREIRKHSANLMPWSLNRRSNSRPTREREGRGDAFSRGRERGHVHHWFAPIGRYFDRSASLNSSQIFPQRKAHAAATDKVVVGH